MKGSEDQPQPAFVGLCSDAVGGAAGEAFSAVGWGTDFSAYTMHSWNVTDDAISDKGYSIEELILDENNSKAGSDDLVFHNHSIVKTCTVKPSATLVAGFLMCLEMKIESRSTPLDFIGTFIVNKLTVDPSAIESGVTWGNIYNHRSLSKLRSNELLLTASGGACEGKNLFGDLSDEGRRMDAYSCSPASLRDLMVPMTWTTVDPDCGTATPESKGLSCKKHNRKFLTKDVFFEARND